jgi:hypothetical protein
MTSAKKKKVETFGKFCPSLTCEYGLAVSSLLILDLQIK